ncbi:hypothetical protein BUALT_Bualt10G0104700 [Buddleja alternifolia]|uniref:Endonuclease/exonuclease/phosphatase domain-containing protein n=1 Tax=Buddleja alternifolia TaxID=168488 RepID=A0AAV6X294_9LAMI|nr:hypothetical protein BUALT_Bualt10G0104700 [Buddleja alternifolia]
MSSRPYFRGGRPQGRRGFSGRPSAPDQSEFVSGDSHFRAVRDANRGFRPSYNAVPPPPQFVTGQQFYGPGSLYYRPAPPIMQQLPGPRQYMHHRPVGPAFGNYQQFRPQQMPQQFRPRASKPPDYRDWEYATPGPPPRCERFTVLSYNILADYLANDHREQLYFHVPRYMMDWNRRKRSICFELGLWSADILCFQEVDRFQDIEVELKPRGYNGIWKMRTGDAADGCSIFWRVSRFKLLHEESIEYNKLGLRDNVAQICVFESLIKQNNSNGVSNLSTRQEAFFPLVFCCDKGFVETLFNVANSNRVVVCNIHVLFNPKRGDVKLGQMRVLLDRAHAVSKLWDDAPIVICGDFNCTPKSPMYNFIAEQKIDLSELARYKVSGQDSADIRPPKPAYTGFRTQPADASAQVSTVNYEKIEHMSLPNNDSSDLTKISGSTAIDNSEKLLPNPLDVSSSESVEVISSVSASNDNHDIDSPNVSTSHESTSVDFLLDEKFEGLALNESVDGATDEPREDCDSFLSELHITDDLGSSSNNQNLHSRGDEILNDPVYGGNEVVIDEAKFSSNPSAWTPAEIQTATGSADCKVMEHPLKLTSAYAEVENRLGIRDSSGEPLVTSYHRRFSGTVDYIWHSEGLQTAKVLAPIPKHVMEHTRGFPTKKWGSDHIALVSELAFTKDISSKSVSQ